MSSSTTELGGVDEAVDWTRADVESAWFRRKHLHWNRRVWHGVLTSSPGGSTSKAMGLGEGVLGPLLAGLRAAER